MSHFNFVTNFSTRVRWTNTTLIRKTEIKRKKYLLKSSSLRTRLRISNRTFGPHTHGPGFTAPRTTQRKTHSEVLVSQSYPTLLFLVLLMESLNSSCPLAFLCENRTSDSFSTVTESSAGTYETTQQSGTLLRPF